MTDLHLDPSSLRPFEPRKRVVQCSNGPMNALMWAFTSCVQGPARMVFAGSRGGGADNASLRANATRAMQWNYSLFHLAHHYYEENHRKFCVTDEDQSVAILLEVTSLRAAPEDMDGGVSGELPRSEFIDPLTNETLGPIPILFVRYLYETRSNGGPSKQASKFIQSALGAGGGIVTIKAASIEEVDFGLVELQRGQSLVGKSTKAGKFNESVLLPKKINKTKSIIDKTYICVACSKTVHGRLQQCSRCKVAYYCGRDCQVRHWKYGGHKDVCCKVPKVVGNKDTGPRKSFVFDIEDAKPPSGMTIAVNYRSGNMIATGLDRHTRSKLNKEGGPKLSKPPTPRNNYGDKEFIVKLQTPAGQLGLPTMPWMCYDGPKRSFEAYIPMNTAGLPEVYALLQRDGVKGCNPENGLIGYKGYFNAKWEGSWVRIFYDRVISPQAW
ncbi:hypothetical protein ACHAWF_018506 [Thalassiosira exigua]